MSEARLKAGLWVRAAVRACSAQAIVATVARKGDEDAGAVLLKLNRGAPGCEVLTQVRTNDGQAAWMRGTGPQPVPEADADAYIARQVGRDGDLWVLEIEDRDGRVPFGGPVV